MPEVGRARLERGAWLLLVLALPFTSLPLVSRLTGSSMVAPAAALVLLALAAVWFVPYLLRGGTLHRQSLPLLAFLSVSLISAAAAFFLILPSFRAFHLPSGELDALVTLAMGTGFYLVVSVWASRTERLAFLLRWINWSGLAVIGWSLLQAFFWRLGQSYPEWMIAIQAHLVTTELIPARVTGFAFEPSWLAHQLNMLYLPWWLAASLRGYTVHRLRLGPLTLERLLLAGGALVLVLSVSRIGLLGFLLMLAFLALLGAVWFIGWLERTLLARSRLEGARLRSARYGLRGGLILGLVVLLIGMFLAAGYGLSRYDPRMKELFNLKTLQTQSFVSYANKLVFAERIIFWEAGWNVFNEFPLLGVGPGNAGFFFPRALSLFSWHLTEVRTLMFRQDVLPNIKSLWVRLLAETGIAGFACFITFLYVHGRSAVWLRRMPGLTGTLGLAGLLLLVGLLTEGFSVDTFGLPYYWVTLGLVAGACRAAQIEEGVERE